MSDKLYRFDVQHSSGKVEQWSNKNGKYVLAQDAVKLQATIAELEDTLTADQALSDVVCMDKDKRITELKLRIAELTDDVDRCSSRNASDADRIAELENIKDITDLESKVDWNRR